MVHVGDVALEQLVVRRPERHAPQRIADASTAGEQPCGQILVVGVERRQVGAERHARGTGKRGDGDEVIRRLLVGEAKASASTRRPSASVLPISTVMPFRLRSTSPGLKALPAIEFSAAGISTRSRTGSFACMTSWAKASAEAAPPMSFFISAMALPGLMSRPPVSKQMPLPTMVTFGACSEPQRRSIRRGARSLALPTAWIMGKLSDEQARSFRHLDGGAVLGSRCSRAARFELGRPEIVRRSIDQIAAEKERFGKRLNAAAIDAVGQHEPLRLCVVLRFVAAEAVGAGEPSERRQLGVWKRRGEAIIAGRKRPRQRTGEQGRLRPPILAADPKQGAADTAGRVRQKQDGARLGRPASRLEPVPLGLAQLFQCASSLPGDEPDGKGLGAACEQQISQVTARFRQGSCRHDASVRNGLDGGPH